MNDTICERCGEGEATNIVEHVLYAEAVCGGCRKDEDAQARRESNAWDMKVLREEYAAD